ncbi:MAG: four-carbon acid sugar kinase family protein [Chloroflexi bacterium]|nr:four-carbon acid sugar kinase family protein [Chloroflexota bacterium]
MTLAILADDLTGACDSSVPFARRGLATRVLLSPRPVPLGRTDGVDVVALDADTRRLSRRLAVARTAVAARSLRSPDPAEPTRLFKKVDSTLRGHVGPELLACMRAWDTPLALLCPAFPATGRWVQGGEIFVDGRGSLGKVAQLAGLPADRRTGVLDLAALRGGVEAVGERLQALSASGARVVVADADTPGHLTTLVAAAMGHPQPVLLAGAGGLAAALAEWEVQVRAERGAAPVATHTLPLAPAAAEDGPPWLVVAGSQTEVTGHQVVELARAGAEVLELDVDELLARPALAVAAGRRAVGLLRQDVTPVLRLVVTPGAAGAPTRGLSLDERAARALARACRTVVEDTTPGGLFLTGGSTARACLLALGISGLRLEQEPLPGIAAGVAIGGVWDGRAVITKSGGFGAPDAMRRLVRPRSPSRVSLPTARRTPPVA